MPRARAKLRGWNEKLTPEQEFDLDPFEPPPGGVVVEGELVILPSPWGVNVTVAGQCVDPDTIELLEDDSEGEGEA